jgi:hypothetical protein
VLSFSNYLDKEIGGYYLSNKNESSSNYVYLSKYDNNTDQKAYSSIRLDQTRPDLLNNVNVETHFHTHLSRFGDSDRLVPSKQDLEFKDSQKESVGKFIINTTPEPFDY